MSGNEDGNGLNYKLWKDEDYPTPPVDLPPAAAPPTDPQPAAEAVETVTETPPAIEPVDVGKLIFERLGRNEEEIRQQLTQTEQLRQQLEESKEFAPDDDFLKNFHKAYKNGGKTVLEQYIEAISVDFTKMSPEQVVEYDVRRELGKDAPKSVVERSVKLKLEAMGWEDGMEPGTPEHQTFQENLTWSASKMREKFASEQQNFKIPERQQPQAATPPAIDQAAIDAYALQARNDPSTRSLLEQKAVKVGDFQIPIDPELLVSQALNTDSFLQGFIKQDGTVNYEKFYQVAAIMATGPEEFYRKAVADAVAAEKLKWIAATRNPTDPDPKPVTTGNEGFRVKFMQ